MDATEDKRQKLAEKWWDWGKAGSKSRAVRMRWSKAISPRSLTPSTSKCWAKLRATETPKLWPHRTKSGRCGQCGFWAFKSVWSVSRPAVARIRCPSASAMGEYFEELLPVEICSTQHTGVADKAPENGWLQIQHGQCQHTPLTCPATPVKLLAWTSSTTWQDRLGNLVQGRSAAAKLWSFGFQNIFACLSFK